LGILAAIAIPRFTGIRQEAVVKAEAATAASIISAARIQEAEGLGIPEGALNDTSNAATLALDSKYMSIPAASDDVPVYTASKSGEFYVIKWTTKATGTAAGSYTLTEGTQYVKDVVTP